MNFVIELLTSLLLTDFPSGSSINYYRDELYVIGDDANDILILDKAYRKVKTIRVFDFPEARIPKAVKADFETSCIIKESGKDHLLVMGSASRSNRMEGMLMPLEETIASPGQPRFSFVHLGEFIGRLKGIGEINIEGSTVLADHIVLSNRANGSNPYTTLVITSSDFWKRQTDAPLRISKLIVLAKSVTVSGVSELCYVEAYDLLLMTLSSEATSSAYDDGAIGDSYIGWLQAASTKMNQPEIKIDGMLNLTQSDARFSGEKIEGICLEYAEGNALVLHLVSDNDQGQSRLFKVKIVID